MFQANRNIKINGSREIDHDDAKNMCACWSQFNRKLIKLFYSFGYLVGKYPTYFIVVPFLISLGLSTGLFYMTFEEDPVKLFVPYTAPSLIEQEIMRSTFPTNYSTSFSPSRFNRHEGHSRIIVTARDDGSILRTVLWDDIMALNSRMLSITIEDDDGNFLSYEDICAKNNGRCTSNTVLNIYDEIYSIENGSLLINYPVMAFPLVLPHFLGGVTINESQGVLVDAKAVLLVFFTNVQEQKNIDISSQWEKKVIDILNAEKYENIIVSVYTSRSIQDELKIKMDSCLPFLPLTGLIMITTCMLMLWTSDCVRSKPLIGLVGLFSAMMAAGASFGFLIYCGALYTRLNVVVLFLVLGIGVDDMFVAISAWQKTSIKDSVPERLAKTYADAAVSVTITSLTNCLAFAVGTMTPTLIVENFCLYCGVTIIFAYFLFITFCGGFLAVAGYIEEKRRHSLLLIKVKPLSKAEMNSKWKKLFFYSDLVQQDHDSSGSTEAKPHAISLFFKNNIGDLLQNNFFRGVLVSSIFIYLGGALYGCTVLKQGLYRDRMSRDDSYLTRFSRLDDLYFRHLPYQIQVAIRDNLNYSDPDTQDKILHFVGQYEASPYGSEPLFTQCWLRGFLGYLDYNEKLKAEIVDERSFIKALREKYFVDPNAEDILDVKYNEDYSQIVASRFVFQAADVKDVFDDVVMMNTFRKIAEDSPFNVTIMHALFNLFDQHALMKDLAMQSIVIAIVLVIIVSLIFIPNPWGSIGIAFSILSIAVGVIGYMAFWDINLDHVSVGSIFMCIGFSVDFSAHITYAFMSTKAATTEEKTRESLFSLGLPIIQGATTTILSLVTFLAIPGYGYRTFFKTIFMVTLFAVYHSIFLIPLFLSWLTNLADKCRGVKKVPVSGLTYNNTTMNGVDRTYDSSAPVAITNISDDRTFPHKSYQNGHATYNKESINGNTHANCVISNGKHYVHNDMQNGKSGKRISNGKKQGVDNDAFEPEESYEEIRNGNNCADRSFYDNKM